MPTRRHTKLIPFAKIDERQALRVIRGFCCAESITEIAAATGLSEKTCRSVVLALRPRLLKQAFDAWREAATLRRLFDLDLEALAQAVAYGCMAKCYFKRGCYTNFQQGRRKTRACQSCPIRALEMGEGFLAAALCHIDLVHTFYFAQGLGGERGTGKLSQFRLRLVHTQTVGEAFEATRKSGDGKPDFSDRSEGAVRDLYERLLRDIKADPLVRKPPPIEPDWEELEDLSWLDP